MKTNLSKYFLILVGFLVAWGCSVDVHNDNNKDDGGTQAYATDTGIVSGGTSDAQPTSGNSTSSASLSTDTGTTGAQSRATSNDNTDSSSTDNLVPGTTQATDTGIAGSSGSTDTLSSASDTVLSTTPIDTAVPTQTGTDTAEIADTSGQTDQPTLRNTDTTVASGVASDTTGTDTEENTVEATDTAVVPATDTCLPGFHRRCDSDGNVRRYDGCGVAQEVEQTCEPCETCTNVGDTDATCEIDAGYCLIADACYEHNRPNPSNECEYCDTLIVTDRWTNMSSSEVCDDGDACTSNDHCNGSGLCVGDSPGCVADDGCCPSDCTVLTDEDCCEQSACIHGDGCCPSHCAFADDDDCSCSSELEVRQPGTSLCWLKCPVGQTLESGVCTGTATNQQFDEAQDRCPTGYAPPTREQANALLGGEACGDASPCVDMFGNDTSTYWTSTEYSDTRAYVAFFETGSVAHREREANNYLRIRCVRVGP